MTLRSRPNPLMARLTRSGRGPSLRLTLWLAFGLGLVTLVATTWETLHMQDMSPGPVTTILLVAGWAITILTPPVTAITAYRMTSRERGDLTYDLLRVTPLPARAVVQGYLLGALHRVRLLLALVVGLMPALPIGILQLGIAITFIFHYSLAPPFYYHNVVPPPVPDIPKLIGPSFLALAMALGLGGLHYLAAASGVGLGLRWPENPAVGLLNLLIVLLLSLAVPIVALIVEEMTTATCLAVVALLVPYAGGAGLARLARRWAG